MIRKFLKWLQGSSYSNFKEDEKEMRRIEHEKQNINHDWRNDVNVLRNQRYF